MAGKQGSDGTITRRFEILRILPSQDSGLPGMTVQDVVTRLPKDGDFTMSQMTLTP
jgi:hypothetical protein